MKSVKTPSGRFASRRDFLRSTMVGASLAAALPAAATAQPVQARRKPGPQDPLAQALSRYGSEFGDITEIRSEE